MKKIILKNFAWNSGPQHSRPLDFVHPAHPIVTPLTCTRVRNERCVKTSCYTTDSDRPHRCCHLPNNFFSRYRCRLAAVDWVTHLVACHYSLIELFSVYYFMWRINALSRRIFPVLYSGRERPTKNCQFPWREPSPT